MIELFKEILGNYIVAGAVILCGICWLVWKLASLSQSTKDKLKEIDTLPCAHHNIRLNSHDNQFTKTLNSLGEMEGKLDILLKLSTGFRDKKLIFATEEYSEKHSPRRLNLNGETLYKDISGEKFLTDNLTFFFSEIDKLSPKTALDVENFALAVLRTSLSNDIFIPLKVWVYNEPSRKITRSDGTEQSTDVSMDDVIFVLSLPLRDKYLELHSEIIK